MLNQFTGMSTERLKDKLTAEVTALEDMGSSDEELGGGDPYEGILIRINDLEGELKRRSAISQPERK